MCVTNRLVCVYAAGTTAIILTTDNNYIPSLGQDQSGSYHRCGVYNHTSQAPVISNLMCGMFVPIATHRKWPLWLSKHLSKLSCHAKRQSDLMHYVTVVLLNLASKLQVMWLIIVFADFHKNNPCLNDRIQSS